MGIKMEKEGYEFKGLKLGQTVIRNNIASKIIVFDESGAKEFIMISVVKDSPCKAHRSAYVTVVLKGCEGQNYNWISKEDIVVENSFDNTIFKKYKEILDECRAIEKQIEKDKNRLMELNKLKNNFESVIEYIQN